MYEIQLPRWNPVHVGLESAYVDDDFLDRVSDKIWSGYITVNQESKPPYLLVCHRGVICETGVVDTGDETGNIGKGFEPVTMEEVDEVLASGDLEIDVYELPAKVCVDLCGVINGEQKYGLDTRLTSIQELLEKLYHDGFVGTVMFTSGDSYAVVEFDDGELTSFVYEGEHESEIEGPGDLTRDLLGEMEINIFRRPDQQEGMVPRSHDPSVSSTEEETAVEPDYQDIFEALEEAASEMSGGDRLRGALAKELVSVDGIHMEDGIVAHEPARDAVFEAFRAALDEEAKLVPADKLIQAAADDLRDVDGGEAFLDRWLG